MDGWGSLTMLIKRQNAEKYRKAQLRYELQKKKEDFLTNKGMTSESDFPELSKFELEKIKEEIRSNLRKERRKNRVISFFILIAVILFLIWFVESKSGAVSKLS